MSKKNIKDIAAWINKKYRVQDLLKHYHGIDTAPGFNFICPYHVDTSKSMHLYDDNSAYCYSECKQYSPFDILRQNGVSIADMERDVPDDFEVGESREIADMGMYRVCAKGFAEEYRKGGDIVKLVNNWNALIDHMNRGRS